MSQQQQPQQQELTPQQQQILQRYQQLYQEYSQTVQILSDIEIERKDHEAVLNALKGYEPDRKCYRMINNVLREMKAADVVPQLEEELVAVSFLLNEPIERFLFLSHFHHSVVE